MKILKYFIILFLFISISCNKDKGNYVYNDLESFELDTVGMLKSFNVQQGRELLEINQPLIASDTTDYDYLWRLYYVPSSGQSLTPYDTLSMQRRLSAYINVEPGTNNTLELRITQKSTGLFKYYTFNVGTRASIPDGWMVIYEKDGMTDIDLVRGTNALGYPTSTSSFVQDTVIRNVLYGGLGGKMLEGTPVSVAANANGVYLSTTVTGINQFKNSSFVRLQDQMDLFIGNPPAVTKPQYIYNHGANFMMYINDGTSYWSATSTAPQFLGASVLLSSTNVATKYEAAPFVVYFIGKQGMFYDKINRRFLYQEQNLPTLVRFPSLLSGAAKFSLDNIGKDLIWMGPKIATSSFHHRTAYFKDPNGPTRWLYILNMASPASTAATGANSSDGDPIDISDLPDIENAKFYETSNTVSNTFYATSTKLYSFFYNAATSSYSNLINPFTAPAGEEITSIRLQYTSISTTTMRRMAIATWNESTKVGKVYLYKIPVPTAGDFDPDPVVTTHDGKILMMEAKTH